MVLDQILHWTVEAVNILHQKKTQIQFKHRKRKNTDKRMRKTLEMFLINIKRSNQSALETYQDGKAFPHLLQVVEPRFLEG